MAAAARTVLDAAGITAEIEERSDSTAAQPGVAFALFAGFIGGTRLGADRAGRCGARPSASAPRWHASCAWSSRPAQGVQAERPEAGADRDDAGFVQLHGLHGFPPPEQ